MRKLVNKKVMDDETFIGNYAQLTIPEKKQVNTLWASAIRLPNEGISAQRALLLLGGSGDQDTDKWKNTKTETPSRKSSGKGKAKSAKKEAGKRSFGNSAGTRLRRATVSGFGVIAARSQSEVAVSKAAPSISSPAAVAVAAVSDQFPSTRWHLLFPHKYLLLAIFSCALGTTLFLPIFPFLIDELLAGQERQGTGQAGFWDAVQPNFVGGWKYGLIISAYLVTKSFGAPVFGRLSDRVGRKRVLIGCLLGSGITMAITSVVTSMIHLLLLRLLAGCFAANGVLLQSYAADIIAAFEDEDRAGSVRQAVRPQRRPVSDDELAARMKHARKEEKLMLRAYQNIGWSAAFIVSTPIVALCNHSRIGVGGGDPVGQGEGGYSGSGYGQHEYKSSKYSSIIFLASFFLIISAYIVAAYFEEYVGCRAGVAREEEEQRGEGGRGGDTKKKKKKLKEVAAQAQPIGSSSGGDSECETSVGAEALRPLRALCRSFQECVLNEPVLLGMFLLALCRPQGDLTPVMLQLSHADPHAPAPTVLSSMQYTVGSIVAIVIPLTPLPVYISSALDERTEYVVATVGCGLSLLLIPFTTSSLFFFYSVIVIKAVFFHLQDSARYLYLTQFYDAQRNTGAFLGWQHFQRGVSGAVSAFVESVLTPVNVFIPFVLAMALHVAEAGLVLCKNPPAPKDAVTGEGGDGGVGGGGGLGATGKMTPSTKGTAEKSSKKGKKKRE